MGSKLGSTLTQRDPTGEAPGGASGRQSHGGHLPGSKFASKLTQRETQRLEDFGPTGEAPGGASGRQSHGGHLPGSKFASKLTQRETQRLEDFDPTGEAPGAKATGILTRFQVSFHVDPNGKTSTQRGKVRLEHPVHILKVGNHHGTQPLSFPW